MSRLFLDCVFCLTLNIVNMYIERPAGALIKGKKRNAFYILAKGILNTKTNDVNASETMILSNQVRTRQSLVERPLLCVDQRHTKRTCRVV